MTFAFLCYWDRENTLPLPPCPIADKTKAFMCLFCNSKKMYALNKKDLQVKEWKHAQYYSHCFCGSSKLKEEMCRLWNRTFLVFCLLGGFSQEELLKIWKGLFYCMWVQDEPLLQVTYSSLCHVAGLGAPVTERPACFMLYPSPMCRNRWKTIASRVHFPTACP